MGVVLDFVDRAVTHRMPLMDDVAAAVVVSEVNAGSKGLTLPAVLLLFVPPLACSLGDVFGLEDEEL